MLIYQKHIFKHLTAHFLLLIFVCTAVVWLSQALKLVYLLTKGITILNFIKLTILTLPSLLMTIIPISLFLSTIYYLNKIKNDREMIVMENSGLSYLNITRPVLYLSLILVIVSYSITLFFLPYSYSKLKNQLDNAKENFTITLLNAKTFNSITKNITLYFEKKISQDVLSNIIIFDYRDSKQPAIILAKIGKFIIQKENILLRLADGSRQFKDQNNNLEIMQFNSLMVNIQTQINKNIRNNLESQEKYLTELWYSDAVDLSMRNKFRAEAHQRLVWPLFNLALVMIAAATIIPKNYQRRPTIYNLLLAAILALTIVILNFFLTNYAIKKPLLQYFVYINLYLVIIISYKILTNKIGLIKSAKTYILKYKA